MKILASVYACSPYDGSERAVGWNWIKQLDKYHQITALTASNYRNDINDYCKRHPNVIQNTKFIYIDVPHTSWHTGYKLERLYYMLWQKEAVKIAKKLVANERFDLVHHITYVTCILPTYMHKLGIPFLYGPISGGENTPSIIRYPMSIKDRMKETIRSASQVVFRATPNFHQTMKKAGLIMTTTEESKKIIPKKYWDKVRIFQAIGLTEDIYYPEPKMKPDRTPKFLAAGRMLYWKGFEMTIMAFVKALKNGCKAELTILGDTENNPTYEAFKQKLKKLCGKYLNDQIKFLSTVEHDKMKDFYDNFDCLLNCSLRDSGCFVVMEAMSRGLPVIVVNAGGPKVNTTEASTIKIEPAPMDVMIDNISIAVQKIALDKEFRESLGAEARKHALDNFRIDSRTLQMNKYYAEITERITKI